jgi:hypothetical protein
MAYTKMTVADFKKRLASGDYKDATGARRGAGKADLTGEEKDQCRRAIDKHFGVEASAPAKKAPKKVKAAPKKPAAKVATNGKAAHKDNGATKVAAKAPKAPKGTRGPKKNRAAAANDPEDQRLLAQLHLANERIGTITQAVDTMKKAKEVYPELDTKQGMTAAQGALTSIVEGVDRQLQGKLDDINVALDPAVIENLRRTAPGAIGLPGQESPVQVPPVQAQEPAEYQPGN